MVPAEAANDLPDLVPVRLNHAVIGIANEAGELAAELQRWLYYGKGLSRMAFKEELGDLLWYAALACNALGLDMGEVMAANIRKLECRYPHKYADRFAAERDKDAEREALKGPGERGLPASGSAHLPPEVGTTVAPKEGNQYDQDLR